MNAAFSISNLQPLRAAGEQGSCLCISCSGTHHWLLPETGHCTRGGRCSDPIQPHFHLVLGTLAGAASPGEGAGGEGCGEANRRCQAAVSGERGGGEPSASAQPARADTARHRWPGALPSDQIKPSKHKATSCMLEGAFLDPRSQHLYFHVPCWVGRGCFQSSWDGAFGQLDFLGSNLPPAAGGARGPGLLEVSGGMGLQGVGEPKELACILLQCAYGNTGDGAWGPGHVPRLQLGPG